MKISATLLRQLWLDLELQVLRLPQENVCNNANNRGQLPPQALEREQCHPFFLEEPGSVCGA